MLFSCGGIDRRMRLSTEDKFLLKLLGKTLHEHQFDVAVEVGLNEFAIVANRTIRKPRSAARDDTTKRTKEPA